MTARRGAALSGCGGIATAEVKKLARTWPDGKNTSWYRGGASSMTSSIAEVASETIVPEHLAQTSGQVSRLMSTKVLAQDFVVILARTSVHPPARTSARTSAQTSAQASAQTSAQTSAQISAAMEFE